MIAIARPGLLPLVDTGLCPNQVLALCIGLLWHFIYMTQVPPERPCVTKLDEIQVLDIIDHGFAPKQGRHYFRGLLCTVAGHEDESAADTGGCATRAHSQSPTRMKLTKVTTRRTSYSEGHCGRLGASSTSLVVPELS